MVSIILSRVYPSVCPRSYVGSVFVVSWYQCWLCKPGWSPQTFCPFLERDGFQSAPLVSLSQDCTSILSVRQTPLAFRLSFLLQPCEGSSEGFVRNGNIPFSSDFICHLFSLLATHLILLSTPFLVDLCGTLIWGSGLSTELSSLVVCFEIHWVY